MKYLKRNAVVASAITLLMGILMISIPRVYAANQWDNTTWEDGGRITVYKNCGFSGGSKRLSAGDYKRIADEGVPNDEISSIRIPAGMSVTVYQHTKFKGASKTLNNDVRCLQGNMNDQISSLKVREGGGWAGSDDGWGGAAGSQGVPGRNHCVSYNVSTSGGTGGFRLTHDPKNFQRIGGRTVSGQICNRNQVQVELSKTDRQTGVLLNVGGRQYRFDQGDGGDKFLNHWYRKYYTINVN